MAESYDPSERTSPSPSWRGRRAPRAPARRRWQSDWTLQTQREVSRWQRLRRLRFAALVTATLALLALLLYVLTYRPRQTPTLAVFAPAYEYPLAPLAWSQEDRLRLGELDGRTLAVDDGSEAWQARDRGMRSLERQLRRLGEDRGRDQCVLIYLAMHGAVDDAGRPCLIPPGASPLAPETWVPVEQLLERIQQTPHLRERPKLLVLDAVRSLTDWHTGVLYNTFAERLTETLASAPSPNLAVLLSAGPGQRSWVSPDLKGSVFAHYFQLGLAGEADVPAEGGDNDRAVSLHELSNYVRRHVDAWTQKNRAASQQPLLLPADAPDTRLAWRLGRRALAQLRARPLPNTAAAGSAAAVNLNALWARRDALQSSEVLRFAPLAWRDYEQKLLWLEQAAASGAAYQTRVEGLARELDAWAVQVEKRLQAAGPAADVFARAAAFTPHGGNAPPEPRGHSIAAVLRYGGPDRDAAQQAHTALTAFLESPGRAEDLEHALAQAPANAALAELHFLHLLQRSRVTDLWPSPPLVRAAALQRQAELLAAPDDPRTLYWTRTALEAGDAMRRQAQDQLFIGADAATAEDRRQAEGDGLEQLWLAAQKHYEAASADRDGVARALRLRDRAFAELPAWARWLTDPRLDGPADDERTQKLNTGLLPLIQRAHALAADLADGRLNGDGEVGGSPPFLDRLDEFERDLDAWRQMFQDRVAALERTSTAEPETLRMLEATLAAPQLSAPARQTLRSRFSTLAQKLHAAHAPPRATVTQDGPDYLTRAATQWREHPALTLLDENAGSPQTQPGGDRPASENLAAWAEARSADVRRRLRTLPQRVANLTSHRAAASTGEADPAAASDRSNLRTRWSQADRLARSSAGFWFPPLAEDPTAGLLRLDLQQLFFWRAQRALDDFWAGEEPGAPPFFAVAATDELATAAALFPLRAGTQSQYDRVASLLSLRRTAAQRGAEVTAADILLIEAAGEATTTVNVRPAPLPSEALPAGRWAVFLRDGQGRLPAASTGFAPALAPTVAENAPLSIPFVLHGDRLDGRGPVLEAAALFRGHEFTAPLVLQAPGGALVESRPYRYGPSQITVAGRKQRQAQVVFILDCSQSMSAAEELEAPPASNAPPRQATRLDVAKNALNLLLEDLAQRDGWRVGVRLFGHRVGFNREQPENLEPIFQTGYAREIPPGLRPGNDEEQILPLGRFDSVLAGEVADLLETVKPWGETPLYLSLDRALRDFDNESPDAERFVVAITDGANKQTNPPPQFARALNDVLNAGRTRRARVYIVGFDIPAAEAAAESEFRSLARSTQGEYIAASNAQELLDAMQRVLGAGEFRVADADGREVARAEVGGAVSLTPAPLAQQPYTVALDSLEERVVLEGGEALDLVAAPMRGRLESVVYEKGLPQFQQLADDAGPSEFLLGVNRPVTDSDGVWFGVSLQRRDRGFTRRPAETWLEVTPVATQEDAPRLRYIFYDAPFAPDTPVPVLNCLAWHWPAPSRQAQVRFWCKSQKTTGWSVLLRDVADRPPAQGTGHETPVAPGLTYQVRTQRGATLSDPFRVAIIERHGEDSAGVGSVKVEMSPPPLRALHQFDEEHRLVLHTFEYATAEDPAGLEREIVFTPFAALESESLRLEDPVLVDIAGAGNLIELTPPR